MKIKTQVPSASTMAADPAIRPSPYDPKDHQTPNSTALEIGVVTFVDASAMTVSVRALSTNFQHTPIPITAGAAGRRHFMGALPEVGDLCVLGWAHQQSGVSRQPVILSWVIPSVMAGHDWLPMQEHAPDDWSYTPKDRVRWESVADRYRHKLRHMRPGDVVASSSKGADLVLTESAQLLNRRGNEVILRDQDQALVVRSLQQFHAGAGFRTYYGMIQRDAYMLPSFTVTDGIDWSADRQLDDDGNPLPSYSLPRNTRGLYVPNPVFNAGLQMGDNINPSEILQNALIIDADGRVTATTTSDAVAGGKAIVRLGSDGRNPAADAASPAFTEYRIELNHTSDGSLPVTEQTDGFDADRLPDSSQRDGFSPSSKRPFVEWVMGTYVGNDPFSLTGKGQYGVPLAPSVLSPDGTFNPGFRTNRPVLEQAAVMLRVTNPFNTTQEAFWSITKNGALKASFQTQEVFSQYGASGFGRNGDGTSWDVDANGLVRIRSRLGDNTYNRGIELRSDNGAVYIYGGASETGSVPANTNNPGLTLQSPRDVLIQSSRTIRLSSPNLVFENLSAVKYDASSTFRVNAGETVDFVTKNYNLMTSGRATETFSGPKDGDASNLPLRQTQFVTSTSLGFQGGVVDDYRVVKGDRRETFEDGSHTTLTEQGTLTYESEDGRVVVVAGDNESEWSSEDGHSTVIKTGDYTVQASNGKVTLKASGNARLESDQTATVSGNTVTLRAGSGGTGGIVSGSDLDPLTGQSLSSLGMGSSGHRLTTG